MLSVIDAGGQRRKGWAEESAPPDACLKKRYSSAPFSSAPFQRRTCPMQYSEAGLPLASRPLPGLVSNKGEKRQKRFQSYGFFLNIIAVRAIKRL